MRTEPALTRVLLLTVALPDFNVEDVTQEDADEFFDGDLGELAYEAMSLISDTARVFVATGDKGGNQLENARAVIVKYDVVARLAEHDEPEDERLTDMLREWAELGEVT